MALHKSRNKPKLGKCRRVSPATCSLDVFPLGPDNYGWSMITDFNDRLTYVGTLDDVVERYPWPTHFGLPELRRQLVTDAIYGKKLLINDGYLIANPKLAGELRDVGKSLLGNLLREGDARLFARGGVTNNIAAGIENSAVLGVLTHQEILRSSDWKTIRDNLENLSNNIPKFTVPWPDDKNMGELFSILIARIGAMGAPERASILDLGLFHAFDAIYKQFNEIASRSSYNGARTIWETCCWEYFGKKADPLSIMKLTTIAERNATYADYTNVRKLMNVANEVCHLAYAVGAGHAIQTRCPVGIDNATVAVSTALVTAFPDLVGTEAVGEGSISLRKAEALSRILISIPSNLDFTGDFSFIGRLRGNHDCRTLAQHYLGNLKQLIAADDDEIEPAFVNQCVNARDQYVAKLSEILAPAIEPEWSVRMEKALIDLLKAPIDQLSDVLLYGGNKISVMSIGALVPNSYRTPKIIERLFKANVEGRKSSHQRRIKVALTASINSYELARRLGLYVGPLKPEGIIQIAQQAKPHPDSLRKRSTTGI
jgi:hypothetical protein